MVKIKKNFVQKLNHFLASTDVYQHGNNELYAKNV